MDIKNLSYVYIDDDAKVDMNLNLIGSSEIIGIDTETTGLDPHNNRIRLLQIADSKNPVLVIDMEAISSNALEKLKLFMNSDSIKVFQNAKFDLKFLYAAGFTVNGPVFDTMLASQIVSDKDGPPGYSLEVLSQYYLDIKLDKEEQKSDWNGKLSREQIQYAARDAAVLLPLREKLIKLIKDNRLVEVCKLEFDCIRAVVDMELTGIGLHEEKWKLLYERYENEKKRLSKLLSKELSHGAVQLNIFGEENEGNINLESQSQVLKALNRKGINLKSTAHYELVQYKDEFEVIKLFLEYRRVAKAVQGFLAPMSEYKNSATGRIHSNYRQIGSQSGRFSCGNPNIQQIPRGKEFRECFIPQKGNKFVIADYSQIELRVAAEIAQDATMIEAYREGRDLHMLTAALIANKTIEQVTKAERQAAKAVNFGLIYAMGAKGLQGYSKTVYGIDMELQEAEIFRERFFKSYKGIANWHARMKKESNVGESRTLSGRRCVYGYEPAITALLNIPVQGTAADIAKRALGMLVSVAKKLGGNIIATVHDEILLEVPENRAETAAFELKRVMEEAGNFYLRHVPVIAETVIADSWAEK